MGRSAQRLVPRVLLALAVGCTALLMTSGCATVAAGPQWTVPASGAATPSTASTINLRAETQLTADLLDLALAQYRTGEVELARETVGDAYVDHYELVEHSGAVALDAQYMLDLELLIASTIRAQMHDGTNVEGVAALIDEAKAGLAQVQGALP